MRPGFIPFLGTLLAGTLLGYAAPRAALPATPPIDASASRYLLIVDTSRAMEPRARAMLKTVQELLKSGMDGQMRAGDTLGVWTYNAQLYAGRFPLQRWSPEQQKAITSRSVVFLKGQKLELLPVLEGVLPALDGVIRNSQLITIVLVTCGDGLMQGTPFDHRINEFWDRGRDKQNAAKMPFVVVLRARDGRLTDCTLNLPPGAVQMPPLPAETQVAATPPQPPFPEAAPTSQPPAVQQQITPGAKPKPLQPPKVEEPPAPRSRPTIAVATNEPAIEETPPAAPAPAPKVEAAKVKPAPSIPVAPVLAPAPISNAPPVVKAEPPKAAATTTNAAKTEPEPTAPPNPTPQTPPVQNPPAAQAANPTAAPTRGPEVPKAAVEQPKAAASPQLSAQPATAAPKPEPTKTPESKPTHPAPVQVAAAALPPPPPTPAAKAIEAPKLAFGPKPTFEPASAPPATTIAPSPGAPGVAGDRGATAPSTALGGRVAATPAKTSPASGQRSESPAAPSPSRDIAATHGTSATNAAPAFASTILNPPALQPSSTPPVQTATATPAESFLGQKTAWIASVLLAAAAGGFALLALRRQRATPHGSLITRSLDRDKRK